MVKAVPTKMEDYKGLQGYSETWNISNICDGVYKMLATGHANLSLKVNFGSGTYDIVIFFREDVRTTEDIDENGVSTRKESHYLSLFASAPEMPATDVIDTLSFSLNVTPLNKSDSKFKTGTYYVVMNANEAVKGVRVIKHFMLVKTVKISMGVEERNQENFDFSLKLRIKPFTIFEESTSFRNQREDLSQKLKRMYQSRENFADVKIELKRGAVLSAHKFILAARSPVLKNTIMSGELSEFDGIIKILDVDIKPMMTVLHWMYTGELEKSITQFPAEVLEIAETFQLTEMTNHIDQILPDFCDTENMTRLFSAAKKYYLSRAERKIASFMKGNITESPDDFSWTAVYLAIFALFVVIAAYSGYLTSPKPS